MSTRHQGITLFVRMNLSLNGEEGRMRGGEEVGGGRRQPELCSSIKKRNGCACVSDRKMAPCVYHALHCTEQLRKGEGKYTDSLTRSETIRSTKGSIIGVAVHSDRKHRSRQGKKRIGVLVCIRCVSVNRLA